jgi:glycosyltransferase involved in cell wall biosynthesis
VAHRDPLLQLVMAGPDECGWQADLARLAMQRNAGPRVTFTGPLYGDCKWGALRSAEVLALPSHTENFGISAVEALACGVPVLISNEVNIWREIDADGAGLVANADVAGTLGLLDRWLNLPLAAQHQMRENALLSFATRFELEHFAREFAACLGAR